MQEAWSGMAGAFDDDETVWKSPIPATNGKVKTDLELEMLDLGHMAGMQCLYSYNRGLLSHDYIDMFHKHFVLVRPGAEILQHQGLCIFFHARFTSASQNSGMHSLQP